jgi:hypothetical protein
LTWGLRFVLALDAKPQRCVHLAKASQDQLQCCIRIAKAKALQVVGSIDALRSRRTFPPTLKRFSSNAFIRGQEDRSH